MSATDNRWVLPAGAAARESWETVIDDGPADWHHTGLRIALLDEGQTVAVEAGRWEYVVVPLAGSARVQATAPDGTVDSADLAGRASVFNGPTDVAFVPAGSSLTLSATTATTRIAVCAAHVDTIPSAQRFRHVAAAEVPVELRGAGIASREVRNFGVPAVLEADAIIACEVITPAGNWSSYPPHKHDEERPGIETELEEIYYFETQRERSEPVGSEAGPCAGGGPERERSEPVGSEAGPCAGGGPERERSEPVGSDAGPCAGGGPGLSGMGYVRVYGTDERPIDVLAEVRTGDVVLVPHGWHGPAMAAPGYDLYYLNVMAGPGPTRAWLICDDPSHGWVRDTWAEQPTDPRLPMGGAH